MKYTLKEYQSDAVADVLVNLRRSARDWREYRAPSQFSLTATTGAGKTVMAAAVIEALFEGDDDNNFEADKGAVVLWVTDDPSLNEQTRFRLLDAGDRLGYSRLKVIENDFSEPVLQPSNVYFLNAQKLSKNALLVKGDQASGHAELWDRRATPDLRANTMWDILRNTIENENLTLYLILDEAHRGMRRRTSSDASEKQTIVSRLINGGNGVPPMPVVWGISATVERFNKAMETAQGRTGLPNVVVDPARVQESGLIKDDIRLDFPGEPGTFDLVLLRRAVEKIKDSTTLWREYAALQDPPPEPVLPLLVVQVPNTPTEQMLLSAFDTVRDAWPELGADAMAHVFGDHSTIEIGPHAVSHIAPERVQEDTRVRVLFAKDGVSTGWDCPRAEVLMSFRPAKDKTHITQLLGRMVRTPLARRIPGNDKLNSVECLLPSFDRETAIAVAKVMLGTTPEGDDGTGGTGGGQGRRVLIASADMTVNAAIDESVWDAFDSIPSQTLPKRSARPVKRLTALAQALSRDGLLKDARKVAYNDMFKVLDGLCARHIDELEHNQLGILDVEGETIIAGVHSKKVETGLTFSELADDRAVDHDYREAGRVLSPDVARAYADYIAISDDDDDGLFDAHLKVAALAKIADVGPELDRAADKLANQWFDTYRVDVKGLSDERQSVYAEIKALSPDPQRIDIRRPKVRTEETEDSKGNSVETRLKHLMSDSEGAFPIGSLNKWEVPVVDTELGRAGALAWYRNPGRASEDSLAIAYKDGKGNWRRLCPDFVFFHDDNAGGVRVSIVDPHGTFLSDALPKLKGLADFTEEHGDAFHRIEAVTKMKDDTLRVLDLKSESVRKHVREATDAEALYLSNAATNY